MIGTDAKTTVMVAICTYKRNEPLACLLTALIECAERVRDIATVGVVVVDDTAAGAARAVAEGFADRFDLGVTYRISGKANISIARNLAMEIAMERGDWIAMTDDDCEPVPDWLKAMLAVQRQTGADTVTGLMVGRAPPGAPRWITDQPFLAFDAVQVEDGAAMDTAYTNNSLISSRWLRAHPDIRFDPALGVIGGEDMVFFRAAKAAGMKIHFTRDGFVHENEPASRMTMSYQMRRALWIGNTSFVTSVRSGANPTRMLVHGAASMVRATARPARRLLSAKPVQIHYCAFLLVRSVGVISGYFGIKLKHH